MEGETLIKRPELLLHICCAPCSTHPIDVLKEEYQVIGLFYGPNIHPEVEYIFRLEEMERVAGELGIELIRAEYEMSRWFQLTGGLEDEEEGGRRCCICYRMRLEKTADYAVERGIRYFTTTLSVSPHKNADEINAIGLDIGKRRGLTFLPANFKKKDGFKKAVEMARRLGLYRQDYCGCAYSRRERDARVKSKTENQRKFQQAG
jgi:predicted adenine nucleotide alpha hydrolase (AANH) superfamily ATPase